MIETSVMKELIAEALHHFFDLKINEFGNSAGIYLLKVNNRSTRTRC